jgi:hypothetical protein
MSQEGETNYPTEEQQREIDAQQAAREKELEDWVRRSMKGIAYKMAALGWSPEIALFHHLPDIMSTLVYTCPLSNGNGRRLSASRMDEAIFLLQDAMREPEKWLTEPLDPEKIAKTRRDWAQGRGPSPSWPLPQG